MKIFIITIIVEILAIISLAINVENRTERVKKALRRARCILTFIFLCMASIFFTKLLVGEILLFASFWMGSMKKKHAELILICSLVCVIFGGVACRKNFYYSPNVDIEDTLEKMEVPEDVNAILPKFVCLHNSKAEKYEFFWEWDNGIYQVGEIPSKNADVFADFGDDAIPYYKVSKKTKYLQNYNFWWEGPKVVSKKEEYTYKVYVPEYSLKEYYEEKTN